jgi:hypothetical protein
MASADPIARADAEQHSKSTPAIVVFVCQRRAGPISRGEVNPIRT